MPSDERLDNQDNVLDVDQVVQPDAEQSSSDVLSPTWGRHSPRGGKAVLNRILREGNKVPLFLGQTFVRSLRDVNYNSTTSALCELIDNSFQWGATEVRVYFFQSGSKGHYRIDIVVLDDGQGMAPNVLQASMSFGASMVYDNRSGIGRYGVGMKTAGLHLSPVLDVYSWQEPKAFYNMTLDVEEIGNSRSNLLELDAPQLVAQLPTDVVNLIIEPLAYPRDSNEQELLAESEDELMERLGPHGTLIYLPDCDRVSSAKSQTLAQDAVNEMSRIYRRFLGRDGKRLYINNRLVEPFDPTYSMSNARHTQIEDLSIKTSRLFASWKIPVPVAKDSRQTSEVTVRLYELPFEDWSRLPRKVLKNDLHLFDNHQVSILRNNRELHIGPVRRLGMSGHHSNNYIRLEIDLNGELDDAIGLAFNKQGVRPKDFVFDAINKTIKKDVQKLRQKITEARARLSTGTGARIGEAERTASDAEGMQAEPLPSPNPQTPEEQAALDHQLKGLAAALKRDDETEDEAYARIKSSNYITALTHDEWKPFCISEYQFGKVLLRINTAHAFFKTLWEPLSQLSQVITSMESAEGDDDSLSLDKSTVELCGNSLVSLQLMLYALARTYTELVIHAEDHERERLLRQFHQKWSENLQTMLSLD